MDRLTRKELKRDPFALEVRHSVEFVSGHRQQLVRYGPIVLAVIIAVIAVYFYRKDQHQTRQELLAKDMQLGAAQVGAPSAPNVQSFATQADKDKAIAKAFTELATKYSGTEEGTVAEFYLASQALDKNNLAEAGRRFQTVVDSGSGPYVSMGKLALGKIYASQGKQSQAEALVRSVIDKPTALVSKEAAVIALAEVVAPQNPQEAKALLGPLRGSERAAVSKAAINAFTDLKLK